MRKSNRATIDHGTDSFQLHRIERGFLFPLAKPFFSAQNGKERRGEEEKKKKKKKMSAADAKIRRPFNPHGSLHICNDSMWIDCFNLTYSSIHSGNLQY